MDVSFNVKPFAFDRVFADASTIVEPEVRVSDLDLQVLTLTAEIERLRDEQDARLALASADAFEAGVAQARGEREAAMLAATDALQASIEMLDTRFEDMATLMQQDAAEVALAAAEVLAARALGDAPGVAIDEAIGRTLKQVARGQELLVRVHPGQVAEVERLLAVRAQSNRGHRFNIQIEASDAMPLDDASIEWDQGGLTLDAATRARAIRDELESLLRPA